MAFFCFFRISQLFSESNIFPILGVVSSNRLHVLRTVSLFIGLMLRLINFFTWIHWSDWFHLLRNKKVLIVAQ